MKKTITIQHTSNMKPITFTLEANLWERNGMRRWYVGDKRSGKLCFDADTGERIKVHGEINNPSWIRQVKEQLGFQQ